MMADWYRSQGELQKSLEFSQQALLCFAKQETSLFMHGL
jgi:hypothetical protein